MSDLRKTVLDVMAGATEPEARTVINVLDAIADHMEKFGEPIIGSQDYFEGMMAEREGIIAALRVLAVDVEEECL